MFDRLDRELQFGTQLTERMWLRREIENYITTRSSLLAYVQLGLRSGDLIDDADRQTRVSIMEACMPEIQNALLLTNEPDPWGPDIKVTDKFLDPLFRLYYERLGTPQQTYKRDYHGLADVIPLAEISEEVGEVLTAIQEVANNAAPAV